MNKSIVVVFICLFALQYNNLQAQEFQIGVKGGINKTFGGRIKGIKSAAQYTDATFEATGEIGYHGGIWTQVNFGKFFIRPEVVYSSLENRFDFPLRPSIYSVTQVSVPILVGYNIYGPLDIYAGGAYNNIIDSAIEGEDNGATIVVQNSPFSAQVGAKVEFGAFGIDVRYDYSLATPENQDIDITNSVYGINRATFQDATFDQIIVSLTIKLFDTANRDKRRRGGNCYF